MTPPSAEKAKAGRNTRAAAAVKAFHEEERFGKAYDLALIKKIWPFVAPHQVLLWLSLRLRLRPMTWLSLQPLRPIMRPRLRALAAIQSMPW